MTFMKNEMRTGFNRYECPECGALRIKTPSGAVCPNGHGKIQPGVTRSMLHRYSIKKMHFQWVSSLPKAIHSGGSADDDRIYVNGSPCLLSRLVDENGRAVRNISQLHQALLGNGELLAIYRGRVRLFVLDRRPECVED